MVVEYSKEGILKSQYKNTEIQFQSKFQHLSRDLFETELLLQYEYYIHFEIVLPW